MSRVVGEHEARQRDLLRQLSFDDEAGRVGVWRCDVGRERARDLRQREGVQLLGGRRVGEATEHDACLLRARGIVCRERRGDDELLLVDAVEAERVERQVFGDAVVEYAEAEAYDGLRRLLRAAVGGPRDVDARREIKMAADVRLRLVAKAVADREVRAHLPVVLEEAAEVYLAYIGERLAAVDRELRGPELEGRELGGRRAGAEELLRLAETLDARYRQQRAEHGVARGVEGHGAHQAAAE